MGVIIELLALLAVAAFVGTVSLLAYRARILFELEFRDGRLRRARGRIPPKLLHDLMDVIPRKHTARLFVRCWMDRDQARVIMRGDATDDLSQPFRNIVGLWPLARLKSAPRVRTTRQADRAPNASTHTPK